MKTDPDASKLDPLLAATEPSGSDPNPPPIAKPVTQKEDGYVVKLAKTP